MREKMTTPSRAFIETITIKAGKATINYFGKKNFAYTKRTENNIVTYADLASNKILTSAIRKHFPTHGIISEEEKARESSTEYVWIIDPLDGTFNFAKEIPLYGVMVALLKNNVPIKAAIYLPLSKELYYAEKGKGLFKNGKKISCGKKQSYKNTCGILGSSGKAEFKNAVTALTYGTETHNAWTLDFGSVAIGAVYTAEGKTDWYVMPYSWDGIWDFVAPALILKESGCVVTGFDNKEWRIRKDLSIVAANPSIHKEIMKVIKNK